MRAVLRRTPMILTVIVASLISCGSAMSQTLQERVRAAELTDKVDSLSEQGKYAEALIEAEKLHKMFLGIFGPDNHGTAATKARMADLHAVLKEYDEAERLYKESLTVLDKMEERDLKASLQIGALERLRDLCILIGKSREAEGYFKRIVSISEARMGRQHADFPLLLVGLAEFYQSQDRIAEAEQQYREAIKLFEAAYGPDHQNVATALDSLGLVLMEMGRYDAAGITLNRALKIREDRFGDKGHQVADSLSNISLLCQRANRYDEAEKLLTRGLKILEEVEGPNGPGVAELGLNLAGVLAGLDRYAESEALTRRVIKIANSLEDQRKGLQISRSAWNNLGITLRRLNRVPEAEQAIRQCLDASINSNSDNSELANLRLSLAGIQAFQGKWEGVLEAFDAYCRSLRAYADRNCFVLTESEQIAFLRTGYQFPVHKFISLALMREGEPVVARLTAGWVLNSKGLVQQELARSSLLARDRKDPKVSQLNDQIKSVRSRISGLSIEAARGAGSDEKERERDRLSADERELVKELGQLVDRGGREDLWIELDEVRRALPKDAVLIEIVLRNPVGNLHSKSQADQFLPPRYAAWIIPPEGELRVVDLGEAEAIDAAVAAARRAIKPDREALLARGEPEVEADAGKPLVELADRVLRPLMPHIKAANRWILSPDGMLWLVPWAALPLNKGRYVVEDHTLQFVVSGRDLVVSTPPPPAGTGQALVMADPDFDLDPAAGRQAAAQLIRTAQPARTKLALRNISRSLTLGSAQRLPGTAAEATAIGPKLGAFSHTTPIVYTGQWALEPVFQAFRRPRVVVLSTHGFFLDDQLAEPDPKADFITDKPSKRAIKAENPLVRCGLLLAGCNRGGGGGDDDGVLTGLEIVGTDLRGTELVVLSACETGLGDVRNGEGVAGLRQAFQLAGARSVMATLWQVPDKETSLLVGRFFEGLASGKDKAESLRQAQLAQIAARRKRFGGAHPFFWAAFTLTGAPDATGGK